MARRDSFRVAPQGGTEWPAPYRRHVQITRDDGGRPGPPQGEALRRARRGLYVCASRCQHFDPAVAYASFDGHRTGDNKIVRPRNPRLRRDLEIGRASDLPATAPSGWWRRTRSHARSPLADEFGAFVSPSIGSGGTGLSAARRFPACVQVPHDSANATGRADRDLWCRGTQAGRFTSWTTYTGLEQDGRAPRTLGAAPAVLFVETRSTAGLCGF